MIAIKKVVENGSWSLERGFAQVDRKKRKDLRNDLKRVLGVASRNGWNKRYRGMIEPTVTDFMKIMEVFEVYGVTEAEEVFGLCVEN